MPDPEDKPHDQVQAAPAPERRREGAARFSYHLPLDPLERKVLIVLAVTGEDHDLIELASETDLDPAELETVVSRLAGKGFIERIEAAAVPEPDAGDEVIDEAELKAITGAAIDEAEKPPPPEPAPDPYSVPALEKLLESLKDKNYYAMLELDPHAGKKEVRRVYYQIAARYHPDQHRDLADPKALELLADVFGLITEAYETLHNPRRRKRYDQTIPDVTGVQESEEEEALAMLFDEAHQNLPAPRAADTKPLGWNFYETAVEAFQAGDLQTADLNFKLAVAMEPGRKEYLEGLDKTKDIINQRQLEELVREARRLEDERKFHEAVAALLKAIEIEPTNAELRFGLARLRFLKTMDRLRAEEDVSWAVALDPRHVEALLLMGRIQAWKGNKAEAVKTFKQVLAIVPGHQKAKQALALFET